MVSILQRTDFFAFCGCFTSRGWPDRVPCHPHHNHKSRPLCIPPPLSFFPHARAGITNISNIWCAMFLTRKRSLQTPPVKMPLRTTWRWLARDHTTSVVTLTICVCYLYPKATGMQRPMKSMTCARLVVR